MQAGTLYAVQAVVQVRLGLVMPEADLPVLTLAISQGGTTAIAGALDSAANTTFTLQFHG